MEHGRTHTDGYRPRQQNRIIGCQRQQDKSQQGESRCQWETEWEGVFVGGEANEGLQQRACHLEGKGHEAYLSEAQFVDVMQQRIGRQHDGLHGIVDQMRASCREQYGVDCFGVARS